MGVIISAITISACLWPLSYSLESCLEQELTYQGRAAEAGLALGCCVCLAVLVGM